MAVSRSTKEEFHEFYKIPDDSDIEVIHNGCDARVFRPPNKDHEKEQLAHERIRKEYGCADEEALNYDPKTQTPMILAVGRLDVITILRVCFTPSSSSFDSQRTRECQTCHRRTRTHEEETAQSC